MTQRLEYIDHLKAVAITLVVFGHFQKSMDGIKNRDKSKVDKIYLDAWTDAAFASNEDPTLTSFYEVLNQQLLRISSPTPSYWQLFYSWMLHHSERLLRRTTIGKGVDTDTDVNKNDMNLQNISIQTEKSNSAALDFATEYLQYRQWKKSAEKKAN